MPQLKTTVRRSPAAILAAGVILALAPSVRAAEPVPPHYQALFFDAAREGRGDLLQGMIKDGMPVDAHDPHGYTALILAAYDGHLDTVRQLLASGADPCAVDAKGNNALMGVAFKGDLSTAQVLLSRCDVNAVNKEGQSAVMMAALFGHAEIVQLMAEHGSDLSLKDRSGNTAASLARQQGNSSMEALLARLKTAR